MGQGAPKMDTAQLWRQYDVDNSGFLDRSELDQLVRKVWKHYKPNAPLSEQVAAHVLDELDVNGDGLIAQDEFMDLYDQLLETLGEQMAEVGGSAASAAGPSNGGALVPAGSAGQQSARPAGPDPDRQDWLRCPHCAFEIDPGELERLRVDPEAVRANVGSWQNIAAPGGGQQLVGASAAGQPALDAVGPLPQGTTYGGRVPPSFFMNQHAGWWAQGR